MAGSRWSAAAWTAACLLLMLGVGCSARTEEAATRTPEPLIPTPILWEAGRGMATPSPVPLAAGGELAGPAPALPDRARFGVGVPGAAGPVAGYAIERLGIGWYLNWQVEVQPHRPAGIEFWQMVRVSEDGYRPDEAAIRAAALANPGSTWLIGNEPDVRWQDNTTPEQYARVYHALYALLKSTDPACQVAIGGVSQPTPLRLAYLDRVLAAYQTAYGGRMPVDVWNVHGFLLREESDSWGVGIPPGMDVDKGVLYEIEDHDDLQTFQAQILGFRRWMSERGYRERPLVLSEYGVLMPADYGFGPERVQAFMRGTFDYMSTAVDEEAGYGPDGNRLVQWWAWYSLADTMYATGNLFDPKSHAPTALGAAFARYAVPGGERDP